MECHFSFLHCMSSLLGKLHRIQCTLYFTVYFSHNDLKSCIGFRIVPAIVLDAILDKNVGLSSVFLLKILHLD